MTDHPAAPPAVESAAYLARQIVGVKHPKSSRSRTRVFVAERELARWEAAIRAAERAPLDARIAEYVERLAVARELVSDLRKDFERLELDRDGAEARAQRLEAALRRDEWITEYLPPPASSRQWTHCRVCDQTKESGHAPDCYLGHALAAHRDDRAEDGGGQ